MEEDETKQILRYLTKECSDKIRLKCRFIYLHGVDVNSIRDLIELIKQFLALRKIWDAIPYDED
ncbi:MAG: hypothetical protein K2J32_04090 [Ruminococcus sp.]|nr:hypothetical protein [Ruminococcus sp.]